MTFCYYNENTMFFYSNLLCCLLIFIRVFEIEVHERQNHKDKQPNQSIKNCKLKTTKFVENQYSTYSKVPNRLSSPAN